MNALEQLMAAQTTVAALHQDECDPRLKDVADVLARYEGDLKAREHQLDKVLAINPAVTMKALADGIMDTASDAQAVLLGLDPDVTEEAMTLKLWALERMVNRLTELALTLQEAVNESAA